MATIITKNSSTASSVPTNAQLVQGELAVNVTDKRLFTENASGTVVELGTNPSSLTLPNGSVNGIPYLNGSKVLTTNSALQFDGSNLGLGVTPSAWDSSWKALQIGSRAGLVSAGDSSSILSQNARFDAGWKYISTAAAGLYVAAFNGQHQWFTAPSGTAGNAISFTQAMTLDASGNFTLGPTTPLGSNAAPWVYAAGYNTNLQARFGFNHSGSGPGWGIGSDGSSAFVIGLLTNTTGAMTERARIDYSGNWYCVGVYNATSGSGANVGVNSAGLFYRSTSSLKYKTDVQDATHGLAEVMALRPVTYKSKNDGDTIFGGLIAEEVHEAGLTEFVQYADDGSPDALAYSNMVSLCIKAIQEQQAIINAQSAALEQLKAQLTSVSADVAALKAAK